MDRRPVDNRGSFSASTEVNTRERERGKRRKEPTTLGTIHSNGIHPKQEQCQSTCQTAVRAHQSSLHPRRSTAIGEADRPGWHKKGIAPLHDQQNDGEQYQHDGGRATRPCRHQPPSGLVIERSGPRQPSHDADKAGLLCLNVLFVWDAGLGIRGTGDR